MGQICPTNREVSTCKLCTEIGTTYKKGHFTPHLTVNNMCMRFDGELVNAHDAYFDTTVYI